MIVELHRLARREVTDALDYFDVHGLKPSSEFTREVREATDRIAANPNIGSVIYRKYRYIKLDTYSYTLFFRQVEPDRVIVYAVAHNRRNPGFWPSRTRNP